MLASCVVDMATYVSGYCMARIYLIVWVQVKKTVNSRVTNKEDCL